MKILLLVCLCSKIAIAGDLPDKKLTPGCTTNVHIRILLAHGYTATPGIRNVPEKVKRQVYAEYHVENIPGKCEVDHLISLELGGCNSIENLWPQSYVTPTWNAHTKDKLENRLAALLRKELATNGEEAAMEMLHQFQKEIAEDWIACYKKHFGK